jgi:hypothetical protein
MELLILVIMSVISFLIYFLPTFVASSKQHKNFTGVLLLNIFLGWTFLGWVAALVWSVQTQDKQKVVNET